MRTIQWTGASGKKYKYGIFDLGTEFSKMDGNYIFAREANGRHSPIYVGETGDLSERFDNHHKMPCIKRGGATHIHAHGSYGGAETRRAEEQDLIAYLHPPCND